MVRFIGLDVHRDLAQIAYLQNGEIHDAGQVACRPDALVGWARKLGPGDQVALEATGNSEAIALLIRPYARRVVVSNPLKTRAIGEAKVKTDKVDARILAQLLAAEFLPPVWLPDERTARLRRIVGQRTQLVRELTRIKNQVHAVLARNLLQRPTATDLFGKAGRAWLGLQVLPPDERDTVQALLPHLDFLGTELICGSGCQEAWMSGSWL
ncbi:transposase, partial [Arthrobacter sp. efr-133-R2A-63]|uniref:IS110 family transposase n=1 Tax=Arthrobacter sp. efr-133-R2A-63 TaxID=3040278 RepID=UPI00254DEDF3